VERLFSHFSCSAHRWSVLKDLVNIIIKRFFDIRWSSKAAVVNAISLRLEKVISALEQLRCTPTEALDTCAEAALVFTRIEKFEIVALLFFRSEFLFHRSDPKMSSG
jgi:hypothetical protein